MILKKQMRRQPVTDWCKFFFFFSFKNVAGQPTAIIGAPYRYIIIQFFVVKYTPRNISTTSWVISWLTNFPFWFSHTMQFKVVEIFFFLDFLKEEIKDCFNEIQPHLCKTILEDFNKPVLSYQQSSGCHLRHMLIPT